MFEGKGDKKKKVYPACPICWTRRIPPIKEIKLKTRFHKLY